VELTTTNRLGVEQQAPRHVQATDHVHVSRRARRRPGRGGHLAPG
jgi:hypothetical protein